MKLMVMGGREEILMKIVVETMIIPEILLERIATSLINPYFKRDYICRR